MTSGFRTIALLCGLGFVANEVMADSTTRVEGRIEGIIVWSGRPVVGAQITACRQVSYSRRGERLPCEHPIDVRTDADGRFSFMQVTGRAPFSKAEIAEQRARHMVVDPGWRYEFRMDYQGIAALNFDSNMGYARSRVVLRCDLAVFLKQMGADGVRPVANPDKMPFMECEATSEGVAQPLE